MSQGTAEKVENSLRRRFQFKHLVISLTKLYKKGEVTEIKRTEEKKESGKTIKRRERNLPTKKKAKTRESAGKSKLLTEIRLGLTEEGRGLKRIQPNSESVGGFRSLRSCKRGRRGRKKTSRNLKQAVNKN